MGDVLFQGDFNFGLFRFTATLPGENQSLVLFQGLENPAAVVTGNLKCV
jgi:hypothetical protein